MRSLMADQIQSIAQEARQISTEVSIGKCLRRIGGFRPGRTEFAHYDQSYMKFISVGNVQVMKTGER